MTIPDAVIEAAAEAIYQRKSTALDSAQYTDRDYARAAIEAAMPAIRQHIANEIHMALCTDPNCEPVCAGAANAVEVVLEGFEL